MVYGRRSSSQLGKHIARAVSRRECVAKRASKVEAARTVAKWVLASLDT